MRGGVPALAGEVEPAAERDRIVDDDDLLMVRPAGRMRIVELEMNTPMRFPTPPETHFDGRFPIVRIDHREVPVENIDVQVAPSACEVVEIFPELGARVIAVTFDAEAAIAVEVPCEDDDRLPRTFGGRHEHLEVIVAVDDERDPARVGDAPAIAAFLENTPLRVCYRHVGSKGSGRKFRVKLSRPNLLVTSRKPAWLLKTAYATEERGRFP